MLGLKNRHYKRYLRIHPSEVNKASARFLKVLIKTRNPTLLFSNQTMDEGVILMEKEKSPFRDYEKHKLHALRKNFGDVIDSA